jgi:hypothetical protein
VHCGKTARYTEVDRTGTVKKKPPGLAAGGFEFVSGEETRLNW